MAKTGPILIIENDADDQQIMKDIFRELGVRNKLYFFNNSPDVLDWLIKTPEDPFLIISDINLPGMNGIELRRRINENEELCKKSIPFIFLTTSSNSESVSQAYEMMVQGYFEKKNSVQEMKEALKMIMDYWNVCLHPNSYFLD